jgi:hypothetical protein
LSSSIAGRSGLRERAGGAGADEESRSMHGVRREKLSKSGALEQIGIAFSGVVGFREAADKSLIELGTFGFAEPMPDGFPS